MPKPSAFRVSMLAPVLLLAACGGAPQAPTSSDTAQGTVAPAEPQAAEATGANALTLSIGATRHALRSDSGSALRSSVYGEEGVETLIIEVHNEDNTLYAKADLYLAAGAPVEGDYLLGHLGDAAIRNQPGHGQVMLAVEQDEGRWMVVSGNGSLKLSRDAAGLSAQFDFDRNGMPMGVDIESVRGEMRVGSDSVMF